MRVVYIETNANCRLLRVEFLHIVHKHESVNTRLFLDKKVNCRLQT